VVSIREVEARVNASFDNTVDEIGDEREWVSILFGNVIQPEIIDA
jgi:hypothetical protein